MLIKINNTTVINLQVFTKNICADDLADSMCEQCYTTEFSDHLKAARRVIDAFGDDWTPKFFIELKKEISKKLSEYDKKHNTNFNNI